MKKIGGGYMPENQNPNILQKIHNDNFKWNDIFIFPTLISLVLLLAGQILGQLGTVVFIPFLNNENYDYITITAQYFSFWGIWAAFLLYFLCKWNRPIYKALWTKCKGNNIVHLLLGLLIGFGTNALCILVAVLHKDIFIYYDSFQPLRVLLIFVCIFIQSSAEELMCRGFLYQRLRKSYRHPAVAIIGNAVLFGFLHIFNSGVTPLAIANIVLVGISYALFVYYCDSIWLPMAAHAAWNFTQNILFGLPNSGIVSPFSIFKLDAATAKDSFAYNVGFGVESTIVACVVLIICCVLTILWGEKYKKKPTDIWAE